ncbi:MAG: sensor domain-containing diguanylate cyclase, partial [Clostridia bacterium]|nr:sensor domain-containing diguanylate cyclase [Clostridia bacterium]
MLLTVGGIGYLVFSGWYSSAKNTTESMASEMNVHIYNQIYSLLHVPEQINESNHKLIANDIIDIRDGSIRDRFFAGVLSSYEDEIYSFSYGTSDGEYYGARRNEDWEIEIMRNDASTGGNSWYYTAKEDLTAGELILKAGLFDPRTRNWYKAAAESGNPTFSPIYKHFIMDDMTVSYACPVYDEQGKLEGILGTHVLLGNIDSYLEDIVSQYKGYAVIIEKSSGELVGNSLADISFEGSDMQRAWLQYKEKPEPEFFYKGTEDGLYINVDEINLPGL